MKTIKFKTNINCGGCVAKVAPALDSMVGKWNWQIDTTSFEKILIVETESISEKEIEDAVKTAGFKIEICN